MLLLALPRETLARPLDRLGGFIRCAGGPDTDPGRGRRLSPPPSTNLNGTAGLSTSAEEAMEALIEDMEHQTEEAVFPMPVFPEERQKQGGRRKEAPTAPPPSKRKEKRGTQTKEPPPQTVEGGSFSLREDVRITDEDMADWFGFAESVQNGTLSPQAQGWELVSEDEVCKLLRREVPGGGKEVLWEYLALGGFPDVSVTTYNYSINNYEFRATWDAYVVSVGAFETQGVYTLESGGVLPLPLEDLVYYRMKLPWPLKDRDFVYARRLLSVPPSSSGNPGKDEDQSAAPAMVSMQKSIQHPEKPEIDDCLRILHYRSNMVLFATNEEKRLDKPGMAYVFYHFDDPRVVLPQWAVDRIAVKSMPKSMRTLHATCQSLDSKTGGPQPLPEEGGPIPDLRVLAAARAAERGEEEGAPPVGPPAEEKEEKEEPGKRYEPESPEERDQRLKDEREEAERREREQEEIEEEEEEEEDVDDFDEDEEEIDFDELDADSEEPEFPDGWPIPRRPAKTGGRGVKGKEGEGDEGQLVPVAESESVSEDEKGEGGGKDESHHHGGFFSWLFGGVASAEKEKDHAAAREKEAEEAVGGGGKEAAGFVRDEEGVVPVNTPVSAKGAGGKPVVGGKSSAASELSSKGAGVGGRPSTLVRTEGGGRYGPPRSLAAASLSFLRGLHQVSSSESTSSTTQQQKSISSKHHPSRSMPAPVPARLMHLARRRVVEAIADEDQDAAAYEGSGVTVSALSLPVPLGTVGSDELEGSESSEVDGLVEIVDVYTGDLDPEEIRRAGGDPEILQPGGLFSPAERKGKRGGVWLNLWSRGGRRGWGGEGRVPVRRRDIRGYRRLLGNEKRLAVEGGESRKGRRAAKRVTQLSGQLTGQDYFMPLDHVFWRPEKVLEVARNGGKTKSNGGNGGTRGKRRKSNGNGKKKGGKGGSGKARKTNKTSDAQASGSSSEKGGGNDATSLDAPVSSTEEEKGKGGDETPAVA
uniref:START domain-containing protein n=1 Tax=Chromera velia CCMP2878 TaxID=1169474 RepID=A0A0G4HQ42_9ALVE|eukprot:Cvel_29988.t1-p1 / transcript=Cvel_29988.t1 / gene=Cvel_29988 / organism=Chromera_velia_CCMP2878 / gene_product=StAR-related lipid transfer protein 7,, putative / transcript_product=StAR-related lipid transfer protein 7,, putative / location=Cvel_scaffold4207:4973-8362(-) / protein_length=979 / sequence_SO=supercontig / SO=protein_coding / is_pseudo=false